MPLSVRRVGTMDFLYSGDLLNGTMGAAKIQKIHALVHKGLAAFERAKTEGLLAYCDPIARSREFSIILLPPAKTPALYSPEERSGYYDRANPGPVIETTLWNDDEIERLILHEMTHAWCGSPGPTPPFERWLEEGVADWVAYAVLKQPPTLALSHYFANPCKPTFYGSSYLWVLAKMSATREGLSPSDSARALLAELHLDLHREAAFGTLSVPPQPACKATPDQEPTPLGRVLSRCPSPHSESCVPLWRTRWGDIGTSSPMEGEGIQDLFFVWEGPAFTGPLPTN